MGVAVRRPLASLNPNHSAEIFTHEQSKSSFAVCFRARLSIFTIRATVFRHLDILLDAQWLSPQGRPMPIVTEGGRPIAEVF
jgi:hypothetical protein